MIQVEKLSYGFPAKDLYKEVSFSLEAGQHCVLIGSNGVGKSTLADMIIYPDKYLFDGKIIRDESCRFGYADRFVVADKERECTVFEYLSERFVQNQKETLAVCEEMAVAEDAEALFEKYQALLDAFEAMDGDNYANNIRKHLHATGMTALEETSLSALSNGEYKLFQIMREMLLSPNVLVLDEPDMFLDFGNLNRLCHMINGYEGTLLVITHNRYLLNHCFNKILHLENCDIQEYEGNYTEYRSAQFMEKLRIKLQSIEDQEEIERTEKMVGILRKRATILVNPVIGSAVNAKQSQLDRLRARQIKAPFVDLREPKIELPAVEIEEEHAVLSITNYSASVDGALPENINFELLSGEKVAIVGAKGVGETTLMRDILKNDHPAIHINEDTSYACLSQIQGGIDESKTVYEIMEDSGFETKESIRNYLLNYCLEGDTLAQRVGQLSGGERNLLQIAMIANTNAELLILDEPSNHLDIFAQLALEKAISEYKGAVLMVSHDFYLVANCADYVLLARDNTIRRMRTRSFRKMVYDKYFDSRYLEIDKKKQELEVGISVAFKNNEPKTVEKLCKQLEALGAQ